MDGMVPAMEMPDAADAATAGSASPSLRGGAMRSAPQSMPMFGGSQDMPMFRGSQDMPMFGGWPDDSQESSEDGAPMPGASNPRARSGPGGPSSRFGPGPPNNWNPFRQPSAWPGGCTPYCTFGYCVRVVARAHAYNLRNCLKGTRRGEATLTLTCAFQWDGACTN